MTASSSVSKLGVNLIRSKVAFIAACQQAACSPTKWSRPPTLKQLLPSSRSSLGKDAVSSGGSGAAPQGERVSRKQLLGMLLE